ncbi:hypothetical protein [Longispora urticae]
MTVAALPPDDWSSVLVRVAEGADGEAAGRGGATLAAARPVELSVQVPGKVSRRTSALVAALGCRVLTELVVRRAEAGRGRRRGAGTPGRGGAGIGVGARW